jgi:hypothetical protein
MKGISCSWHGIVSEREQNRQDGSGAKAIATRKAAINSPPLQAPVRTPTAVRATREMDLQHVWHGNLQHHRLDQRVPLEIVAGEGCRVTYADGRRYLDAMASLWRVRLRRRAWRRAWRKCSRALTPPPEMKTPPDGIFPACCYGLGISSFRIASMVVETSATGLSPLMVQIFACG